MSTFSMLLYGSLSICAFGTLYRIGSWYVRKIGFLGQDVTLAGRISGTVKGLIRSLFSLKILFFLKAVLLDVIWQARIFLKAGAVRWLAHMLIFAGFIPLLLLHALDDIITVKFFPGYYSTINPYLFLRSLFGVMVLAGIFLAIARRFVSGKSRVKTTLMDKYAIFIVAFIIVSGILLEGLSMTSHSEFERMIYDYAGMYDEEEIRVLESYWVSEYGLVSPNVEASVDEDTLFEGEQINDMYCTYCHVSNKYGFSGYAAASVLKPAAMWLDRNNGVKIFWYIHIVACFFGLAMLPFTKMFHIISVPVSYVVNAVREDQIKDLATLTTTQVMELDACTHCGVCSQSCSAVMMYEVIGNRYILPSEKMQALKKWVKKKKVDTEQLSAISQGIYVCTNCERCTVNCPSGIRLKDLWLNVREEFIRNWVPESNMLSPFSFMRGLQRPYIKKAYKVPAERAMNKVCSSFAELFKDDSPLRLTKDAPSDKSEALIGTGEFYYCFECRNCTVICPVVSSYDNPGEELGLLPHQIMCCLGLNLTEMASESKMNWYCLTCYQCQEHCPQGVPVCDYLYHLKNYSISTRKEEKMK